MQSYLMVFLMAAATNSGQVPDRSEPELKKLYLACEMSAQGVRMEGPDAAACSKIYEDLKRRAFDGSFRRLRAWYDGARPETATRD